MKQLTDGNFNDTVGSSGLSVIMFSAPWAGPCNMARPAFEEVASRFGNQITFGEFVIDDNPGVPSRYGVKGIPTFYLLKDGAPVSVKVGAVPIETLITLCEDALDD
jgi:thioredoxin 1